MSQNDDDSIFEQALKGDLPSAGEQARLRKRLLAAGLSVGSGLTAASTASAQAGWGATVAAKVAALSWPMTLVLGAAVATPIVALPVWLSPKQTNLVASSAARPRPMPSVVPVAAPPRAVVANEPASVATEPASSPSSTDAANTMGATRAIPRAASSGGIAPARAAEPSAAAANAQPAVAAFDGPSSADSSESARRATTLAAETQLLDRAFAELAAGHQSNAAALIAEHQRRFPNGLLSQERERARARLEQNSKGE